MTKAEFEAGKLFKVIAGGDNWRYDKTGFIAILNGKHKTKISKITEDGFYTPLGWDSIFFAFSNCKLQEEAA